MSAPLRPASQPLGSPTWPALGAFLRRDLTIAWSYRLGFLLDLGSMLFQVMLFFFLSRLVDASGMAAFDTAGAGYFSFAIIGIVMLRIVDVALRSFANSLRGEQMLGTFEALLTTPARLSTLMLGNSAYELLYGTVGGLVMLLVAFALGVSVQAGALTSLVAVVAVLATLAFFAALGLLVAAFVVVFKQGMPAVGLLSQALALLGGVYYPVDVFPRWLQLIAELLPFTWALQVLRAALLDGQVLWGRLGLLVVTSGAVLPLALAVLSLGVRRARRRGTLGQY